MFAAINSRQISPNPANTNAAALVNRRQSNQTEADPTQLLMHWYNNETRKWTHLTGGSISEGAFVVNIPPLVLRNQGFSGMLANMLVTEVPYSPKACSDFETLVNGKCVVLSCSYYALLERWDAACIEEAHCLLVYWYAYACVCVLVCICVRVCIGMHMRVCVYWHAYACVCVLVCI